VRADGSWGHGYLMTSRFEVHVSGRLPQTLAETIGTRFGPVTIRRQPTSTVLTGHVCGLWYLRGVRPVGWSHECQDKRMFRKDTAMKAGPGS
jgi:hypothetical protein